jgi:hypothetical protein
MSPLLPSSMTNPLEERAEVHNPEGSEGPEGSTAKDSNSTNDIPTENDDK